LDSHAAEYNSDFTSIINRLYLQVYKSKILAKLNDAKIITTGINEQKYLKNLLNIDSQIISLGADIDEFKPNFNLRKETRYDLGLNDKDIVLVHAGKINNEKKSDWVIEVFLNLKFQITNLKLLIIGNSEIDIPSTNDVIHLEFVNNNELNKYFNASDIGLWPGSKSNTVVEAMASGLPIIVEDKEYSKELVINNNGFTVSSKEELEIHLKLLIKDEDFRHNASSNSRIHAVNNYSWTNLAKDFLK
jgi:glycosyltransferase involved in cell wall biosynthesis